MRKIVIDRSIAEVTPLVRLGIVFATVTNTKHSEELWEKINSHITSIVDEAGSDIKQFLNQESFNSVTRTFKALGVKKSSYIGSNEALFKRILQNKGLYEINTVVDINNLVSLYSKRSVGTYDLDKLNGEIEFKVGKKEESYLGTTKRPINLEGLTVLCDSDGPFGSPYSDSSRALIQESTKEIAMIVYSFDGDEDLDKQLCFSAQLLKQYVSALNVKACIFSSKSIREIDVDDMGDAVSKIVTLGGSYGSTFSSNEFMKMRTAQKRVYEELVSLIKEDSENEFKQKYEEEKFDGNFVDEDGQNLLTYCVKYLNYGIAHYIVYETEAVPGKEGDDPTPLDCVLQLDQSIPERERFLKLFDGLYEKTSSSYLGSS